MLVFHAELQKVFAPMQGKEVHNCYTHMQPFLRDGKLTVNIMAIDKDSDERTSVIVHIIPSMLISGWPPDISLQNPFPTKSTHRKYGQKIVQNIQDRIESGDKMICLEGPCKGRVNPSSLRARTSLPLMRSSRPTTTSSARSARPWTSVLTSQSASSTTVGDRWNLNFEHVEKYIQNKLFKYDFMKDASLGYDLLLLLREQYHPWNDLSIALCRTILLSTIKRAGLHKTPEDCFLALLAFAQNVTANGICPQYFQAKMNNLAECDKASLACINRDLQWMLKNLKQQPYVIAQMCQME